MFVKLTDHVAGQEFSRLQTRSDVAAWLGISEKSLRYFLYGKRVENLYSEFDLAIKGGGFRKIRAPHRVLKTTQRKLADKLSAIYEPRQCVYGFVKDKNIIDNAQRHVKSRCVLNIDIKDFFEQIHVGRIIGMLTKEPYSIGKEAATIIAQLVCYYKRNAKSSCLPQGAPTSPIISNMICSSLDTQLTQYAKRHHLFYTRYADDISLSTGKRHFDSEVACFDEDGSIVLGGELRGIFSKASFGVNDAKLKLRTLSFRQEVTGLVVNKRVNVKREYIKTIRSILHNCETDGVYNTAISYLDKGLCVNPAVLSKRDDAEFMEKYLFSVIKGKLGFMRQVRGKSDSLFIKYASQANRIFEATNCGLMFDLTYANLLKMVIHQNVFVLHTLPDNENIVQATGFFIDGHGLFTSHHVVEPGEFLQTYYPDKFPDEHENCFINPNECFYSDRNIDYAVFDVRPQNVSTDLKIGDSGALDIGDTVTIAGFPNFNKGNSINVQECKLTENKFFMGSQFWKIGGRVVHGMSGGIVLNDNVEVVGILKGGIVLMSDDENNDNQGFVPIHYVLDDIVKAKKRQAKNSMFFV